MPEIPPWSPSQQEAPRGWCGISPPDLGSGGVLITPRGLPHLKLPKASGVGTPTGPFYRGECMHSPGLRTLLSSARSLGVRSHGASPLSMTSLLTNTRGVSGPLQPLEPPWPTSDAHWTGGQELEARLFCGVLGPAQRPPSFLQLCEPLMTTSPKLDLTGFAPSQ